MPLSPKDTLGPRSAACEVLYESATTRVWRSAAGLPAPVLVFKEYRGPRADERQRAEKGLLARLSGVEGVAQLGPGQDTAGVIALQDCGAVPLAQVLKEGRLGVAATLSLARQLGETLARMHRLGVVHRDINPANILVDPAMRVFLIDFDLAVAADEHAQAPPAPALHGTLGYLAPEQSGRTGRQADSRSDLYALGATLYEMATGRLPFEATDTLELIAHHLVTEPPTPSQVDSSVPAALSDIILRLLAKAPEKRYQSADGLVHDLARLCEQLSQGLEGSFALGERDFPARLEPPDHLVGRDAECAMLHAAFKRAMETSDRTVLVEGSAGIGKTALVNELRPGVAEKGGWFVHGKAEQFQREAAATGVVTHALRALGRLLLSEPATQLDLLRTPIVQALGRNAALVTELLPEFSLLLGPQPKLPEVDPRVAEARFGQTMVDLLGAIASPERPLVLVMDDLQWAGPSSLRFLERVMNSPALTGLLVVGVYRADEPAAAEHLLPLLARWSEQENPPLFMKLENLSGAHTGELIGQVLRLPQASAVQLAHAVSALTRGNPFDTLEMLDVLRSDGVLTLGAEGWNWNSAAITRFVGRSDVVDLLGVRIGRLPVATRTLLEYMSCLGSVVDMALLVLVTGMSPQQLQEQLAPAREDGLIILDPASAQELKFRHDRVQQAVMAQISAQQRGLIGLELTRQLAFLPGHELQVAQHCLASMHLRVDAAGMREAAQLFFIAAQKLFASANHLVGERYLSAARSALASIAAHESTLEDIDLRDAVDAQLLVALYSIGRLEEMDELFTLIESRTPDPLELVELACLKMRGLDMRSRVGESMELGLRLLAALGVTVPPDYDDPDTGRQIGALIDWVREDERLTAAQRPQISDRRLLAVAKLLGRTVRSAFMHGNQRALVWLLLECQRMWVRHGACPELVVSLARMSIALIHIRQDYKTAFHVSRHVVEVGEALGYEHQMSEARAIHAAYACCWFEPLEIVFQQAFRAFEGLRVAGDVSYACYAHRSVILASLEITPTLEAVSQEIEAGLAMSRRVGNTHAAALTMCERQVVRALRAMTNGPAVLSDVEFEEAAFEASMHSMPPVALNYHTRRALHSLLLGDMDALQEHVGIARTLLGTEIAAEELLVPSAVVCAWQIRAGGEGSDVRMATVVAELERCRAWLAGRAQDQPYNFLHLLRFVEAEQAYAMGQTWKAAVAFDAAVGEVQERQRPWHRALITERAGLFHISAGLPRTGRQLLGDALEHYRAWGASTKVAQMLQEHDFLRRPQAHTAEAGLALRSGIASGHSVRGSSGDISSDAVDLMGVLRASQALSSETSVERLAARVTQVLAALSGATRVLVLSWHEPQWWLLAPAPGEPSIEVTQAARRGLLPLSVVAYADRTGEALVVDDAVRDDRFARDPYFAGVPLCSLMVAPISSQGAARAMLVLESRVSRAAFGVDRLDAVMLIAGQLAVSLANAQLYESLEQRVSTRTRELEHTQSQLVTTARRAGKAEIANNVLHNVGNVLNSVNVSASVVRRTISQSRALGLARAIGLLNEHHDDLPGFMERDPRGKALLPYLNEVVEALRQEREAALADLDRLTGSVEHITYVVANQQSHSGPSSVMEDAHPGDLMEEALRLSAEPLLRYKVGIQRRYANVPQATLDRQRVLQILVNLIGNAAQAMEGLPEESRELTVIAGLTQTNADSAGEGGEKLHLTVQDVGEGIAPQNLSRIFSHGFTTRKSGHGFGLHSAALAAMEMGGRLTVYSDGPGKGARFTVELPLQRAPGAP